MDRVFLEDLKAARGSSMRGAAAANRGLVNDFAVLEEKGLLLGEIDLDGERRGGSSDGGKSRSLKSSSLSVSFGARDDPAGVTGSSVTA